MMTAPAMALEVRVSPEQPRLGENPLRLGGNRRGTSPHPQGPGPQL